MYKRFLVRVDVAGSDKAPGDTDSLLNVLSGISGGQVDGDVIIIDEPKFLERVEAIGAFMDDEADDKICGQVLSIIDRLMADDWSDTGVYDAIEKAMDEAGVNA